MRKTNPLYESILAKQDPSQVEGLMRFFKTGKGQYGEGDQFLGIKVPVTREVVKQCWQKTSFDNLETCIQSEYHEIRLAALLTLVQQFMTILFVQNQLTDEIRNQKSESGRSVNRS